MINRRIVCAISGVALNEDDEAVLGEMNPSDETPELPVGWTKITIENRSLNPNYEVIQHVKANLVRQVLSQVSPEERESHEEVVSIQIDAQFAALEAKPDNVATLLGKVEVYVAPPERVPGLSKELEKVFSVFGLEVETTENGEDEEDEGGKIETKGNEGNLKDPSDSEDLNTARGMARRRRRRR
jgi:hypothetical protein